MSETVDRLRAELAEVIEQRDIRRQDCDDLAEQSHERLQRALKAEAEVERLLKFTTTCTCDTSYETYEGPQADCPVHGVVRAYNEEQAESERLRAELAQTEKRVRAKVAEEILADVEPYFAARINPDMWEAAYRAARIAARGETS